MTFVVGYDDSPGARRALEVAIDLAVRYDEPLVLVYGVAPPGGVGEEFAAHQKAVEELGRTATAAALEQARAAGVRASVELARAKPAQALVQIAERVDARMVVVGTYGESPFRGVILGSTTFKVLGESDRPVLVVKG